MLGTYVHNEDLVGLGDHGTHNQVGTVTEQFEVIQVRLSVLHNLIHDRATLDASRIIRILITDRATG